MAIARDGCLTDLVVEQLFDHGMLRGLPESTCREHYGEEERRLFIPNEWERMHWKCDHDNTADQLILDMTSSASGPTVWIEQDHQWTQ